MSKSRIYMRLHLVFWTVIFAGMANLQADEIPELREFVTKCDRVLVDAWYAPPDSRTKRHLRLDSSSPEVAERVANFLVGLDCVRIESKGPLATNDVVGVTLEANGKSITLNLLAGTIVSIPERKTSYEIMNVSDSAGQLLIRKLLKDYPDLMHEIP